jgi:hypothetical protein
MKKKLISIAFIGLLFGTSVTSQAALFDRGNGLIFDNDLNVTWLADANYSKTSGYSGTGVMNWYDASTWVGDLTFQGHSDWRLPTPDEMDHLFYRELGGVLGTNISTLHNPHYALFSNVQNYYWSNTDNANHIDRAVVYNFAYGNTFDASKTQGYSAIAVLPGDVVSAVPEPETYALLLAGLGLLGWRVRRQARG